MSKIRWLHIIGQALIVAGACPFIGDDRLMMSSPAQVGGHPKHV